MGGMPPVRHTPRCDTSTSRNSTPAGTHAPIPTMSATMAPPNTSTLVSTAAHRGADALGAANAGHHESVLRSHRNRTAENSAGYLLPHLHPGQRLLDIGSGPGTITADLATIVGASTTTALEVSPDALALTTTELDRRGIGGVTGVVGDVHALPFPDASFDVVHAHQVLQHLPDPVLALREMARVTAPGGVVAVRDSEYATFSWHPAVPALNE